MTAGTKRPSFFIGWDVGGWNCDNNSNSRDAIVILDDDLTLVGKPWRGNLRESIRCLLYRRARRFLSSYRCPTLLPMPLSGM